MIFKSIELLCSKTVYFRIQTINKKLLLHIKSVAGLNSVNNIIGNVLNVFVKQIQPYLCNNIFDIYFFN